MSKEEASGAEREQALEMILKVLSTVGSREESKILKEQIENAFPQDRILLFAVAKEWLARASGDGPAELSQPRPRRRSA